MDDAHRPRIDPDRGEAKMGMDFFFLARATDPQHAKAALNCLGFSVGCSRLSHGGKKEVIRMCWQWQARQSNSRAGLG